MYTTLNKWNGNLDPIYAAAYIFWYRFSYPMRRGPFRITRSVITVENRPSKYANSKVRGGNEVMKEMSRVMDRIICRL